MGLFERALHYEATTTTNAPSSRPVPLAQRTPIRVLHRRSNMIRDRNVLSCRVQRIDDHYFRLHISTDAGTCKWALSVRGEQC